MAGMTTQAIVLRSADYRDYDRILTLFAHGHGKLTAAARGCRRIKSPLLNVAVPFVHGEFVLTERQGRLTVASCQVEQNHYPLRTDPLRLSHAAYLAALCEEVVQEGQSADRLYALFLKALAYLSFGEEAPEAVSLSFMMRLLDEQGIGPILTRCASCGGETIQPRFAFSGMGVLCERCAPGRQAKNRQAILTAQQARLGDFLPLKEPCEEAFMLISRYIGAHFYKDFKALHMIAQLAGTSAEVGLSD